MNIYVKLDFSVKGKLKVDNVHASFAVHAHTGIVMSKGKGAITTMSRKQKLNTKLVGADDVSTMMLWTKLFMVIQSKNTFCTRLTRV